MVSLNVVADHKSKLQMTPTLRIVRDAGEAELQIRRPELGAERPERTYSKGARRLQRDCSGAERPESARRVLVAARWTAIYARRTDNSS